MEDVGIRLVSCAAEVGVGRDVQQRRRGRERHMLLRRREVRECSRLEGQKSIEVL